MVTHSEDTESQNILPSSTRFSLNSSATVRTVTGSTPADYETTRAITQETSASPRISTDTAVSATLERTPSTQVCVYSVSWLMRDTFNINIVRLKCVLQWKFA